MADDATPEQLMTLALGVLPPPPFKVEVLSEDGGSFELAVTALEDDHLLHAYGPRDHLRTELHLLARITDESRGRYEVEFEVREAFFHSGAETLAHVAVSGVRHRKMRRAAPRVAVAAEATAIVIFCRTLPRDSELDVRLADVSTTGIAFTSPKPLTSGDLLTVACVLHGEPVDMEVRVIRCDPAPYNRFRIGCEITELQDTHREVIGRMTDESSFGSASERGTDSAAARHRLRGAGPGLMSRIRPDDP